MLNKALSGPKLNKRVHYCTVRCALHGFLSMFRRGKKTNCSDHVSNVGAGCFTCFTYAHFNWSRKHRCDVCMIVSCDTHSLMVNGQPSKIDNQSRDCFETNVYILRQQLKTENMHSVFIHSCYLLTKYNNR